MYENSSTKMENIVFSIKNFVSPKGERMFEPLVGGEESRRKFRLSHKPFHLPNHLLTKILAFENLFQFFQLYGRLLINNNTPFK